MENTFILLSVFEDRQSDNKINRPWWSKFIAYETKKYEKLNANIQTRTYRLNEFLEPFKGRAISTHSSGNWAIEFPDEKSMSFFILRWE